VKANRWVLSAAGHPLATGVGPMRLHSLLKAARKKLKASDGTLGGLLSRYSVHLPVKEGSPEFRVRSFAVTYFSDSFPFASEDLPI
jgi:hypothetical protein